MKGIYFVGALAAIATSCVRDHFASLDCDARTLTPTGSLEADVVGSWDSFGIDSRVVFTFYPDGGITAVDEPNPYDPHGSLGYLQYRVFDGGIDIESNEYSASINETSLTLVQAGFAEIHPALSCRGKGFE